MTQDKLYIEELNWRDVQTSIHSLSPDLAKALEQCESKHNFIKASYSYGNKILQNGQFNLPLLMGSTIALDSEDMPSPIAKQLDYNQIPFGLVLTKSIEKYYETDKRVMPEKLFTAGEVLGLSEFVNSNSSSHQSIESKYSLSSGARTVFMLPKIADAIAHGRLKRDYSTTTYPPKKLIQQGHVFAELAKRNDQEKNWKCEVLFFTKKWLVEKKLVQYCLEQAWQQSLYAKAQLSFNAIWEDFSKEVTRRNLKPRPYIINTLKHIMAISKGVFPGFIAADNTNIALPTELIQEAYINSYQLKKYIPTIMVPQHFNKIKQAVYYSLSFPTLLEYAPQAGNSRSIMADIRELKQLITILFICLNNADNNSSSNISCEFFHSDIDSLLEIRPTSEMLAEDSCLINNNKYSERDFSDNSAFFRGCIRISKIN